MVLQGRGLHLRQRARPGVRAAGPGPRASGPVALDQAVQAGERTDVLFHARTTWTVVQHGGPNHLVLLWTILQHDGPNHLGLCAHGLFSNMTALITSNCCGLFSNIMARITSNCCGVEGRVHARGARGGRHAAERCGAPQNAIWTLYLTMIWTSRRSMALDHLGQRGKWTLITSDAARCGAKCMRCPSTLMSALVGGDDIADKRVQSLDQMPQWAY